MSHVHVGCRLDGPSFASSPAFALLASVSHFSFLCLFPLLVRRKIMKLSTYQAHLSVIENNEVIFVKCFELLGKRRGELSRTLLAGSTYQWSRFTIV